MFEVTPMEHWIEIRFKGGAVMRDVLASISNAPPIGRGKVLVDVREMDLSDTATHAIYGEHMAENFGLARVALVVPEKTLTYDAERAGRRRGLDVRTFVDRAEAEEWLRKS